MQRSSAFCASTRCLTSCRESEIYQGPTWIHPGSETVCWRNRVQVSLQDSQVLPQQSGKRIYYLWKCFWPFLVSAWLNSCAQIVASKLDSHPLAQLLDLDELTILWFYRWQQRSALVSVFYRCVWSCWWWMGAAEKIVFFPFKLAEQVVWQKDFHWVFDCDTLMKRVCCRTWK